jgi:hypothetical protein
VKGLRGTSSSGLGFCLCNWVWFIRYSDIEFDYHLDIYWDAKCEDESWNECDDWRGRGVINMYWGSR